MEDSSNSKPDTITVDRMRFFNGEHIDHEQTVVVQITYKGKTDTSTRTISKQMYICEGNDALLKQASDGATHIMKKMLAGEGDK